MLKALFLLSFLILLNSSDCDSQKQDEKIRSLEADVKQLKAEVVELKQKPKAEPEHHYELRTQGFRTWRFDPTTGETCIQLTSADDWKRKQTKSQSCDCTDSTRQYSELPRETEEQQKFAENYYNFFVKHPCGF